MYIIIAQSAQILNFEAIMCNDSLIYFEITSGNSRECQESTDTFQLKIRSAFRSIAAASTNIIVHVKECTLYCNWRVTDQCTIK